MKEDELLQPCQAMIRSLGKILPSVSASPPLTASKAGECNVCDSNAIIPAQELSISDSVSCKPLNGYDPPETQSMFQFYEDEDDWEFAGDDEKEDDDNENAKANSRYLTGAVAGPNLLKISLPLPVESPLSITVDSDESNSGLEIRRDIVGFLDEEIGQPSACDWLEPPPISEALGVEESQRQIGNAGVMLEAFQQFQQNPQVQEMVVALATDEGLWRAVLANKKIQELRFGNAEGDFEVGITPGFNSVAAQSRMTSSFILLSRNAVRELEGFWDQIRGIIDVVDKKLQAETRQLMFEVMLRVFIMMIVFMLTLIAFLCLLPLQASLE